VKVRCTGCRAKYRVPDKNVEKGSARITCKRCDAKIRIAHLGAGCDGGSILEPYAGEQVTAQHTPLTQTSPEQANVPRSVSMRTPEPTPPPTPPRQALPNERSFYLSISGQTKGPYKASTVLDLVVKGKLGASTFACATDSQSWLALPEHGEFRALFPAGVPAEATLPLKDQTTDRLGDPVQSQQQQKVGEATRMVLLDAGVLGREEKHRKWGKVVAVLAAGFVFGFVTIGAAGWFWWKGRPEVEVDKPSERRIVLSFDDVDADAASEYAFLLESKGAAPVNGKAPSKRRRKKPRPKKGKPPVDGTTTSDDQAADDVREQLGGGLIGEKERTTPTTAKEALVEQSGGLEAGAVREVYKRNRGSLGHCVQQAAKSGTLVPGKHSAVLAVEVTGRVNGVRFESGALRGSELGQCLGRTLKRWMFPPFAGGTTDVEIPLVLAPG
jgi:hypothetical protein